jgi:tagatose-1,6-bisphosphate aldolase
VQPVLGATTEPLCALKYLALSSKQLTNSIGVIMICATDQMGSLRELIHSVGST